MGMGGGSSGGGGNNNGETADERQKAVDIANGLDQYRPDVDKTPYGSKFSVGNLNLQNWDPTYADESKLNETRGDGRSAQMAALDQLHNIATNGLTGEDRAQAADLQHQINSAYGANHAAIMSHFENAGAGGANSGSSLVANLLGSAGANDANANFGTSLFKQALAQKMAAIGQMGQQGANLRAQDFGVDQAIHNATQSFNNYRAGLKNQADQAAVANANTAAQYNLGKNQQYADNAVDTTNANLDRGNQLRQQDFTNRESVADRQMAGYAGAAQSSDAVNAANAQRQAGYAGLALGAAGTGLSVGQKAGWFGSGSGANNAGITNTSLGVNQGTNAPAVSYGNAQQAPYPVETSQLSGSSPYSDAGSFYQDGPNFAHGGVVHNYADGGPIYGPSARGQAMANSTSPGAVDEILGGAQQLGGLVNTGKNLYNGANWLVGGGLGDLFGGGAAAGLVGDGAAELGGGEILAELAPLLLA